MAISKHRAFGGGFEGRCTVHRGTPQEKWRRTKEEAESKRKAALKKALNKLRRALNQISTLEIYTTDLNEEMSSLQKRLEESDRTQMELTERLKASTSTMHEKVEHYKTKMQETLDKLRSEETLMANMVKELEAIKKDKARVEEVVAKVTADNMVFLMKVL